MNVHPREQEPLDVHCLQSLFLWSPFTWEGRIGIALFSRSLSLLSYESFLLLIFQISDLCVSTWYNHPALFGERGKNDNTKKAFLMRVNCSS